MKKLYQAEFGPKVEIIPLKIAHCELDAQAFLSMMAVNSGAEPPLYVQIILVCAQSGLSAFIGLRLILPHRIAEYPARDGREVHLCRVSGAAGRKEERLQSDAAHRLKTANGPPGELPPTDSRQGQIQEGTIDDRRLDGSFH